MATSLIDVDLPQAVRDQVERVRAKVLYSTGKINFPPLLLGLMKPGICVHADRGVGKTRALLYAVHNREHDNAIVVALTREIADDLYRQYKREYGRPKTNQWPRFVTAANIGSLPTHELLAKIYCDEWFQYSEAAKGYLRRLNRVAGAVGTQLVGTMDENGNYKSLNIIKAFPL